MTMPRCLLLIALLTGCVARPAVIVAPNLAQLPSDDQRRNALISSAAVRPGAERRKPLSRTERKVVTAAATAAAVVGYLFSSSRNVTVGVGMVIDVAPPARPAASGPADEPEPVPSALELVPWVRFGQPVAPTPAP